MALRRLIVWKNSSGFVTTGTPAFVEIRKVSDGVALSAGSYPTIAALGTGSNAWYFDHEFTEDYFFVIDSGVTADDPAIRYFEGVAGVNDLSVTVLRTPDGAYQAVFNTVDALDAPIASVDVQIVTTGGTAVDRFTTNASGTYTINIGAGDYLARAAKVGASFAADVAFTISAAATVEIEGTVLAVTPPADGLQTVYGYIRNGDGTVPTAADIAIIAEPSEINMESTNGVLLTMERVTATASALGYFEIALYKGASYKIYERYENKLYYKKAITITAADTRNLVDY